MRIEKVSLRDVKTGDQIAVKGNIANLHPSLVTVTAIVGETYLHHGIYDKETSTVIEFHGDNKANAVPKKRDFLEFFAGHTELYRVVYEEGEECFTVEETMKRAENAVKTQRLWAPYHLITNNCESFATYIKTGKQVSKQVLEALIKLLKKIVAPVVMHGIIRSRCRFIPVRIQVRQTVANTSVHGQILFINKFNMICSVNECISPLVSTVDFRCTIDVYILSIK